MNFRDLKRRARRDLHHHLAIPANLYQGGDANRDPVLVHIRKHDKPDMLGDVKGTSYSYAEKESVETQIVFRTEEADPRRHDVVVFEPGEAFRVDTVMPSNGITTKARVNRLTAQQAELYEAPR